ncbi:HNH endonuclease signature motif containing protein [Paeniglutamicibacter quisquiliarum]|uniref:HNH endonuclease signature motif containing protein n=1 Tax=Paeniglutamicibacter quisquiliarum TaxID=2849498 RepID=UPI0020C1C853|nr:HNH endonuclease signature motif containing protein [Paeniglutamicibacter quisquiliarum]
METDRFIKLTAGTRGTPGHPVSPDDELRALLEAQALARDLARRVSAHTHSPVRAALFARAAEDEHRAAAHTRLLAADTARRTLAHELPGETFDALAAIHRDPSGYLAGTTALPQDPRTVPTGRPVFKDTRAFLSGFLHISFFEARERVRSIDRLLPGTDINGVPTRPKFPVLAGDFADGTADPGQIGAAARKLEALAPGIDGHPDAATLAETLEDRVAESVRTQDPRTTAKLLAGIQTSLERGPEDLPEEVLRTRTGLFYRGTTGGLGEFLLRTLPRDTEALLAMCASTDNPRTKAGDRDGLLAQSLSTTGTGTDAAAADTALTDGSASGGPSDTAEHAGPGAGFPDFLTDPATGAPLTDPATIRNLSLDPDGLGNLFTPATAANDRIEGNGAGSRNELFDPGTFNSTAYGGDGLTPPQRHLQGLLNLIRAAGQPRTGKKTIGLPSPKTLVIATLDELRGLADTHGITSRGQRLTPAELRQGLCNGGVIPAVMGGRSQILDLGQEERFFPEYMREIILGIYGGCIMPGCTVPPEHCEIDHDELWKNGGTTNIQDGRPLCSGHHHARHTGLIDVVRADDGLFSVILPKFMDPEQKPRRNAHWRTPAPPLF